MPRSRKQPVAQVVVVTEVKVPEVLITRQQYIEDIKVRWQIHQYEVNKLVEDVRNFTQIVVPYIQKALDFTSEKYQEVRAKYATVQ
jgi:hypothetical protein